jgi:hypothetical protein
MTIRVTPANVQSAIHPLDQCMGQFCPFHNPSPHHMAEWNIHVRLDKGALVERICAHGIGHPDPDSLAYFIRVNGPSASYLGVHGCDGCCRTRMDA